MKEDHCNKHHKCVQKQLDEACKENVEWAQKVNALVKDLNAARLRLKRHPALTKLEKEEGMRQAIKAEYNAVCQKLSALSNLNLECHAWKLGVIAANEERSVELDQRTKVQLTSLPCQRDAQNLLARPVLSLVTVPCSNSGAT